MVTWSPFTANHVLIPCLAHHGAIVTFHCEPCSDTMPGPPWCHGHLSPRTMFRYHAWPTVVPWSPFTANHVLIPCLAHHGAIVTFHCEPCSDTMPGPPWCHGHHSPRTMFRYHAWPTVVPWSPFTANHVLIPCLAHHRAIVTFHCEPCSDTMPGPPWCHGHLSLQTMF